MYVSNEVIINQVLLDRVLQIKEKESINKPKILADDLVEQIKLTRLGNMVETCTEEEIAALVLVALERYPEMVYQILFEEYKKNKESKNDSNNRSRQGTV